MLGETSIIYIAKMMFCVVLYVLRFACLPLTYWNLSSSKILVLQWLLGLKLVYCVKKKKVIYLPKKVCLIIIDTNTTHILDMSCCHKHQQRDILMKVLKYVCSYTICMLIYIFPLTKAIPIMFEWGTTH